MDKRKSKRDSIMNLSVIQHLTKQNSKFKGNFDPDRFSMYLNPIKRQTTKNHHPNFADYSQANRELMRLKNLRQADRIKMQIVEGLKGRISEEQYQQFSKWVEDGNSVPLPKLRKMASRYKQKYIFEKLKEDDIIQ